VGITATAEKYAQLNGHKGAVYAVSPADSPNHVFTVGSDGIIARWDIENSISSGALAQVQAPVFSLLYCGPTKTVWAGREDGGLHVIDTVLKRETKLFKNHEKGVFSIIKSSDKIYTSGGDGTIAVTDIYSLRTVQLFKASDKKVRGLYYSENKALLYTASADGMVRGFSDTGLSAKLVVEWGAHDEAANTIAQLSDDVLITGGRDARLKLWDISTGIPLLLENIPAHNYAIYQIQVLKELGIFITCSRDKTIKIWDLETLQVLKRINRVDTLGHKNSVNSFVYFKENKNLISVGDDGAVMVWKLIIENR
jgi:WD40 repeat protein